MCASKILHPEKSVVTSSILSSTTGRLLTPTDHTSGSCRLPARLLPSSGKGAIGTLVYNEEIGHQIEATLANIREISDKLSQGQGALGKLISDESLFLDAKATLKKEDTALDGFSDQGSITAGGVGAQAIF